MRNFRAALRWVRQNPLATFGGAAALVLLLGKARKGSYTSATYKPYSPEARDLLVDAARGAGLPESWGDANETHYIMSKESAGRVGIPNYTWTQRKDAARWPEVWNILKQLNDYVYKGNPSEKEREARWATFKKTVYPVPKSTATGLGQLLLSNVRAFYPDGATGIGDPYNEAVGFLRYIDSRYGSPQVAYSMYGKTGSYTHARTGKVQTKGFQEGY